MLGRVDIGAPIAYEVLEKGVPVLAADGAQVATVCSVLADDRRDIFHGLVLDVPGCGKRVVLADDVAALHERGVDLKIDAASVRELERPGGGAPVYREDPGALRGWSHWLRKAGLKGDWKRDA